MLILKVLQKEMLNSSQVMLQKYEFTNKKSLKPSQPSVNQVSLMDPAFLAMIQFSL